RLASRSHGVTTEAGILPGRAKPSSVTNVDRTSFTSVTRSPESMGLTSGRGPTREHNGGLDRQWKHGLGPLQPLVGRPLVHHGSRTPMLTPTIKATNALKA